VADPVDKVKDAATSAAHPVETAKDLAAEADRGRSPRTPLIALTGVTLVIGVIFAVVVTIGLVLYFVYGGK
jgi:hypothetical protein